MTEDGNGYRLDKRWIEDAIRALRTDVNRLTGEVVTLTVAVESDRKGISVAATIGATVLTAILSCGGTWMVAKWQMGSEAEQARAALIQVLKDNGLQPAGDRR